MLSLVSPSVAYRDSYLRGMRALKESGLPWLSELNLKELEENFEAHVRDLLARATTRTATLVPETVLWAIEDGEFAASFLLREALPVARGLGLKKVLITCDDTNLASIRVIEKNGGVLEGRKRLGPGLPEKRYYWIQL